MLQLDNIKHSPTTKYEKSSRTLLAWRRMRT